MGNPFEKPIDNVLSVVIDRPSKKNIKSIIDNVISSTKEQDENYLDTYIKAKALEEIAKGISDGLKEDAKDEADGLNLHSSEKYIGCTLSIKNGVDKYSFAHNEEWARIDSEIQNLTARKKEIEKSMIEATKYSELTDKNGEVIPPAELIKGGGTVLSVTLPKE